MIFNAGSDAPPAKSGVGCRIEVVFHMVHILWKKILEKNFKFLTGIIGREQYLS